MAPSPNTAAPAQDTESSDLIVAATAVFGALELLAEVHIGENTHDEVLSATRSAYAHLARAGLTREELIHPSARTCPLHAVGAERLPPGAGHPARHETPQALW